MDQPILFIIRGVTGGWGPKLANVLSKDSVETNWGDVVELEYPIYSEGETPFEGDFDIEEGRVIVSGDFARPDSMQPWLSLAEKHALSVLVIEPPAPPSLLNSNSILDENISTTN